MKKGLKRILIVATVLLLVCAGVVIAMVVGNTANKSQANVELDIYATNLSFSNSVYIKYAVAYKNVNASDIKMLIWTKPQTEYIKGTESAVLENAGTSTVEGKECLVFDYKGLAAKQMTDDVYARAYVKIGDAEYYSAPQKYSVLQYAFNMKNAAMPDKTTDPEGYTKRVNLLEMLDNMLNYGALAQKYTNYKTDCLATDDFVQIKLSGGTFADGFKHGLYKVGTTVKVFAPAQTEDFAFVGWRNTAGEIVSTSTAFDLTVGASNEFYTAIYQGNTSDKLEYIANEDGITYSVSGIGGCTDDNIVIPSVIGNKLITGICDGAFKNCTNIKSVTFSSNIAKIGAEAFSGCTSLKTIYFDGVRSQWNQIVKGTDWKSGTSGVSIVWNESEEDWELGGVPLH